MSKSYYSLGLMSGTSGMEWMHPYKIRWIANMVILDKYYKYTDEIYKEYLLKSG